MTGKPTIDEILFPENILEKYTEKLVYEMSKRPIFQTDKKIKEIVPAHTIYISVPYVYKNEFNEICFGTHKKKLFSFGKKEIERYAYRWEVETDGNKIHFKRYGELNKTE